MTRPFHWMPTRLPWPLVVSVAVTALTILLGRPTPVLAHCCVCSGSGCTMVGNCTDNVAGTDACATICANLNCPNIKFETESDCGAGCVSRSEPGDCNGDGRVTISELVMAVAAALGERPVSQCPELDLDHNGQISVAELVSAVNAALGF